MNDSPHKAGRPRKVLDDKFCASLLDLYEFNSQRSLAKIFKVSPSTINNWLKYCYKWRDTKNNGYK